MSLKKDVILMAALVVPISVCTVLFVLVLFSCDLNIKRNREYPHSVS